MTTLDLLNFDIKHRHMIDAECYFFISDKYEYVYRLDDNRFNAIHYHGKYWSCINLKNDFFGSNFNYKSHLEKKL